MKILKHELIGAKIGEIRIQYATGGFEEDAVIDAVNIALARLEQSGIKREPFTEEDMKRFNSMDD